MNADILLSPPIAFAVFLLVSWAIYLLGGRLAPASTASGGTLEPYACGEPFEAEKMTFGYRRFFLAAIFFTVMHVAVLAIATVPGGVLAWRALGYLAVIAASISVLFADWD